jgi:hypothetical protein
VLSHLQFAYLYRKSIWMKWSNYTVKVSTGRTSSLMVGPSMPAEAEKHMDGEMQCFVYLCEYEIRYLTTIDCFFKVCYVR